MGIHRQGALAGIALATALFADAPARGEVHLGFDPPNGMIECAGSVNIITDASADSLRGFSLVVEFDPAIVEVDAVLPGTQLTDADCPYFLYPFITMGADSVAIDGATLGCSTVGPGVLATIVFSAIVPLGPLVSPLTFRRVDVRDAANATLETSSDPGTITVTCTTPVESVSWGEMKASYRGEGRRR